MIEQLDKFGGLLVGGVIIGAIAFLAMLVSVICVQIILDLSKLRRWSEKHKRVFNTVVSVLAFSVGGFVVYFLTPLAELKLSTMVFSSVSWYQMIGASRFGAWVATSISIVVWWIGLISGIIQIWEFLKNRYI